VRAWLLRSATPYGASLSRLLKKALASPEPETCGTIVVPLLQARIAPRKRDRRKSAPAAQRKLHPQGSGSGKRERRTSPRTSLARFVESAGSKCLTLLLGFVASSVEHRSFHTRGNDRRLLISSRTHSAQPGLLASLVIFRVPSPLPGCSATIANVRFRGLAQALVTSRGPQPLSDGSLRMTTRFAEYSPVPSSPSEAIIAHVVFGNDHNQACRRMLAWAFRTCSEGSLAPEGIRWQHPVHFRVLTGILGTCRRQASLARESDDENQACYAVLARGSRRIRAQRRFPGDPTAGGFVAGCSPWIS